MDRSWITAKKRLKKSISTTFRFGVEVKACPVIGEWHQSGWPHMHLQSSKPTQQRHAADLLRWRSANSCRVALGGEHRAI
jgi:hypothetical protein